MNDVIKFKTILEQHFCVQIVVGTMSVFFCFFFKKMIFAYPGTSVNVRKGGTENPINITKLKNFSEPSRKLPYKNKQTEKPKKTEKTGRSLRVN